MRVYLDACALGRLSDDQRQTRVYAEAEAVEQILRLVLERRVEWSASTALRSELQRNPNRERRSDALALLSHAGPLRAASEAVIARAKFLAGLGYGAYDALHLSHSEQDRVDALITTDDRFLKLAGRGVGDALVRVVNPIDWIEEVRRGSN